MGTRKNKSNNPSPCRTAFTLIELLVVVAIIALLIAILLPSLAGAKRAAQRTACAANLKAVGNGYALYAGEWDNSIPTCTRGAYTTTGASNLTVLRNEGSWPIETNPLPLFALARYVDPRGKQWACPATPTPIGLGAMTLTSGQTAWDTLSANNGPSKTNATEIWMCSNYVFWVGDRGNSQDNFGSPRYFKSDKSTRFDEFGSPADGGYSTGLMKANLLRPANLIAQDFIQSIAPLGYGNHTRGGTAEAERVGPRFDGSNAGKTVYAADWITTNSSGDQVANFDGVNALRADSHVEWVAFKQTTPIWSSRNNCMWYVAWERP